MIEEKSKTNHTIGILTGFKNIDDNIHGLESKCTYYLKATSGTGKSSLALNIGENIAKAYKGYVLYFTLESTDIALTMRRISRHSKIALTRIKTGNIRSEGEWESLVRTAKELSDSNMLIIENSKYRWFESMRAFCESFALENETLLIIVDFLQLVRSRVKQNSRHLELSYISDCFNFLAKNIGCPVMILSQVNKDYQTKESRDIENNADNVWLLERKNNEDEYLKLIATKGKDIGPWKTWLKFDRFIQKFSDCEEQYETPN
jgi:replicative DNA helicase